MNKVENKKNTIYIIIFSMDRKALANEKSALSRLQHNVKSSYQSFSYVDYKIEVNAGIKLGNF